MLRKVLLLNIDRRSDYLVICWIYNTAGKKRKKVLANNPDSEFKLLKENHKKDRLIGFLESELYGTKSETRNRSDT